MENRVARCVIGGVSASTPFARSYLRQAWADAQAASVTLLAKLTALNSAAVSAVSSGKTVLATAGNGRSVTFTKNEDGGNPMDVVDLTDRLLRLYDAAVAAGNATDATRYTYMMGQLVPIREVANNFSYLRQ